MQKCKQHVWTVDPDNTKHAKCSNCGTNQFIARLKGPIKEQLRKEAAVMEQHPDMPVIEAETAEQVPAWSAGMRRTKPIEVEATVGTEEVPKLKLDPVDLLLWVGKEHYSVESFIEEAKRMGVSRRVQFAPLGAVPGKSRVFLAHRDAIKTEEGNQAGIFAYFVLGGISYIVSPGMDLEDELKIRGVETYDLQESGFGSQDERSCGSLQVGGIYLLSEEDMNKVRDLASSSALAGKLVVLEEAIPIESKSSRTYRYVMGDYILDGFTEEVWYDDAHDKFRENEKTTWKWRDKVRKKKAQAEAAKQEDNK